MTIEAYKELIEPVQEKMYRFALKMTGDPGTAQDVVQDVLVKVWKKRDQLDHVDNFEAWCMTLVRNRCIDKFRSKHRRTQELDTEFDMSDDAPDPQRYTENQDMMELVKRFMQELPDSQKQVLHLREIECMTYREIADTLDLSMSQVKVNLYRARNHLKTRIEKALSYGI